MNPHRLDPLSFRRTSSASSPIGGILQDEGYHTIAETGHKGKASTVAGMLGRGSYNALQALNSQNSDVRPQSPAATSASDSTMAPEKPDVGLEALARDPQRLIQAIQNLRHLGIETLGVSLPKICVVGDQSTGKSSLIEGMSGIKVPRNDGVCTRCPIEILLIGSHDSESAWRCKVYLFRKYAYLGGFKMGTHQAGATEERPLGPWQDQEPEDELFATVATNAEVGEVLHWAQLAILNPGKNPLLYKPGANSFTPQDTQVMFSPNCVRIEISSPGLPNLAFYDLPGIISNPIVNEEYLIKLVRNLVIEYIKDDNCICLLALPMSHDVANCIAAGIISQVGAQQRTTSVLTKPDCVQPGSSLSQWTSLIRNKAYHVVKNNPNPKIDHTVARLEEIEYFKTHEPYATALAQFADQFGTFNLQSALSAKLTAQILTSLPRILDRVEEQATTVGEELRRLPKAISSNPVVVVNNLIMELCQKIRLHVEGGRPEYPFQKQWRDLTIDFQKELGDSRPRLALASSAVKRSERLNDIDNFVDSGDRPVISLDSDDEEPLRSIEVQHLAKRYTLVGIRELIEQAYVGIQGQVDPRVSENMSTSSMEHWPKLAGKFLERTRALTEKLVSERIDEVFLAYEQTPLYGKITDVCGRFLVQAMEAQKASAELSVNIELDSAMTSDDEIIHYRITKALAGLQAASRMQRATLIVNEEDAKSKKSAGTVAERIAKAITQLGPDPYDQELNVMATTRAYYECAFSRLVDDISHRIKYHLFRSLTRRENFQSFMMEDLGVTGTDAAESCATLLAIDPKIEERRKQLLREEDALQKARIWLQGLAKDHDGDSVMDRHRDN
ncbi:hypothetical protein MMC13_007090 [Lambiella insularis]|nr:hypothetical protein [Lambiella insularis]